MSNSNRVSAGNLEKEISKYLTEFKESIEDDVKEIATEKTKEARNELKSISPKSAKEVYLRKTGTGESDFVNAGNYAKAWSIKDGKKLTGVFSKVVYNKGAYRLTHLLEFGHANRNGSRTKSIPHIRKTEDKYKEEFAKELENRIRR